VLGPIVEEMLFRGIIYGGYHRSLGPVVAAVLTIVLFVVPHAPNLVTFPLALVGIMGLALTTLWLRVRASAIGPAIAAHISYNVITVIVTPVMS
jgi:membrane protease YdiL (CAAX protease family)